MIQSHTRPFALRELKIEVTYYCNLNCVHCSSDARPSNTLEIPLCHCLRILEEAGLMGVKEVAFSGGEPLAWPHIFRVVETARTSGLTVSVYTSGNVDSFEDKARRLSELGTSRVIFSIFGSTAITYERVMRTAGSFEKTKSAMREAHCAGLVTEVHFVPMLSNYLELAGVSALGQNLGARAVSVLRLLPQGRASLLGGNTLTRIQNLELRREIQELRTRGFSVRTGSPYNILMLSERPKCSAAIDRLIIGPDLKIYPCDAFKRIDAEELVGTSQYSALDTASLQDCWDRSPYLEAIREYLTTPFAASCGSCRFLNDCLSGCLAQKVLAYGKMEKRNDPDCFGPR